MDSLDHLEDPADRKDASERYRVILPDSVQEKLEDADDSSRIIHEVTVGEDIPREDTVMAVLDAIEKDFDIDSPGITPVPESIHGVEGKQYYAALLSTGHTMIYRILDLDEAINSYKPEGTHRSEDVDDILSKPTIFIVTILLPDEEFPALSEE